MNPFPRTCGFCGQDCFTTTPIGIPAPILCSIQDRGRGLVPSEWPTCRDGKKNDYVIYGWDVDQLRNVVSTTAAVETSPGSVFLPCPTETSAKQTADYLKYTVGRLENYYDVFPRSIEITPVGNTVVIANVKRETDETVRPQEDLLATGVETDSSPGHIPDPHRRRHGGGKFDIL